MVSEYDFQNICLFTLAQQAEIRSTEILKRKIKICPTSDFRALLWPFSGFTFYKSQIRPTFTNFSSKLSLRSKFNKKKNFWFGVQFKIWGHLGSNFKLHWNLVNCITKSRSWRKLSKKVVSRSSEVVRRSVKF